VNVLETDTNNQPAINREGIVILGITQYRILVIMSGKGRSIFPDMVIMLQHALNLGAYMFCISIFGLITSRNMVRALMCLELLFNAVNINLVHKGI
jgi:hypothetical protein